MNKVYKKRKRQAVFLTLLAIIMFFIAILFVGALPKDSSDNKDYAFTVREGDTLVSVSQSLYEQDLIRSPLVTRLMGRTQELENIVFGNFLLKKSMSAKEILFVLNDPSQTIHDEVTLTFLEGWWARDFANLIEQKTSVSAKELLTLWSDPNYLRELIKRYDFLGEEILLPQLTVGLEGYLAPNTYNFLIDNNAENITETLLDQTEKIYKKYQKQIQKSKHSFHDIITLASITQFESGKAKDNELIAGVWENRLKTGMKIESSVTVCYALYDYDDWEDCEMQTQIDSPYNTYRYEGLPIGPVSNPGEDAIKATLMPKKSDYLFFIADVYGDGKVHYAKTFEEHQANINKYLR